ncbi:MAG: MFS transporter, partial [Deltaproteobacteria bacterium]|nr:MFS transporter [Deltaproteobacteria bacterium]
MRTPALTIRLYPLFAAISFTPVMVPGLVLFWEDNGLDTFEVFLLQAVFAVAVVVLEVPTGMVADRVGKRTSLLAGQVVVALGSVFYALGTGFWSFLGAEVTLAVGMALLSGADSALLYDCLKQLGRESEFAATEARTHAVRLASFALANVVGGLVIMHSLRGAMWASAVGPVLAVPIVACFAAGRVPERKGSLAEGLAAYRSLTTDSLKFVSKHRLVRWFLLFQA